VKIPGKEKLENGVVKLI